jgi:hypothetical protein
MNDLCGFPTALSSKIKESQIFFDKPRSMMRKENEKTWVPRVAFAGRRSYGGFAGLKQRAMLGMIEFQ